MCSLFPRLGGYDSDNLPPTTIDSVAKDDDQSERLAHYARWFKTIEPAPKPPYLDKLRECLAQLYHTTAKRIVLPATETLTEEPFKVPHPADLFAHLMKNAAEADVFISEKLTKILHLKQAGTCDEEREIELLPAGMASIRPFSPPVNGPTYESAGPGETLPHIMDDVCPETALRMGNGEKVRVLLDTGAYYNIMSLQTAKKLDSTLRRDRPGPLLALADGSITNVVGRVMVPIEFDPSH